MANDSDKKLNDIMEKSPVWEDSQRVYKDSSFKWTGSPPSYVPVYANVVVQFDGSVNWTARILNNAAHGLAPDLTQGRARALKALVCLAMLDDLEHGEHTVWPPEITGHDLWREVAL